MSPMCPHTFQRSQLTEAFQSHGAMENWGLITYRTTAVLFDEHSSDQKYKNRVVYVVAHELAHQWFGNLVTMDWWNELWLNEGFATWVGWYAVDHLHPDWNVWGQFVTEGMQTAFNLDSLRTSHPIEVPVRNALEVDQIFDAISYLKGSSVIRMLASHLGVETFLKGVGDYLIAHQYGNATTNDLWSALGKASGQDVTTFMDPWIRKIGFPVVTVAEEPGQLSVKQSRFLSSGDVKAEEDETTWWIPMGLKTGPQATDAQREALTTKEDTYRDIDTSFYKVNGDQAGFYRVNLPPQRLVELSKSLDKLSVQDKIGLVGDAAAMASAGEGTTAAVLSFMEGFSTETNYLVWSEVLKSLGSIRRIFSSNEQVAAGLRAYTLKLVSQALDKVGWELRPHDDYLIGQLRALLISTAGLQGHEGTVQEAQKRFTSYTEGNKDAIAPSLRKAVFTTAVKHGGEDAYKAVQQEFLTTKSIDGKEMTLAAMGHVQTPELGKAYLDWVFHSGKVAIQDVHTASMALGGNSKTRDAVWEYTKANWPMLYEKLGGNMVVLDRFVRVSLNKFSEFEVDEDIRKFFEAKDNKGYDRSLAIVSDTIRGNAKYKERDMERVKEWLGAHGYLK
jgi:aminopeptidase N